MISTLNTFAWNPTRSSHPTQIISPNPMTYFPTPIECIEVGKYVMGLGTTVDVPTVQWSWKCGAGNGLQDV